jgi:hypothetical protein
VCAPRVPLVEARRQVLNVVVACWIGAVPGLLCLEVLFGVHLFVAEHNSAVGAVVGGVVTVHSAVEAMVGRFCLWWAGVGSRGGSGRCVGPFVQLSDHGGRCRVLFPPITVSDIWVVDCFGDGMSLLFLLSLAFVLSVVVRALAFTGVAFTSAIPSPALSIPCPSVLLALKAFPPRLGISGDREEYCAERYVTKSLYVRVATLVLVDFHVAMGVSNCGHLCRKFSSQWILVISLI